MAKVISHTKEDEVVYMHDPDIEFVSLVKHGANRFPIQITKAEGDTMPNKVIQSVLVPKYTSQKKLEELAEQHSLSLDKEAKSMKEYDGFNVFKQVEDEKVDLEKRELAVIDEESGVYGVVAELKEEDEEIEGVDEKQFDYATMDDMMEALMAMTDVVMGAIRQPQATDANRRNTVLTAVDNFRKYAEAVLSNSKAEDVADVSKADFQRENLKDLLPQPEEKEPSDNDDQEEKTETIKYIDSALEELTTSVMEKVDEKISATDNTVGERFENLKNELNENLNQKFEELAEKEKVDNVETQLEELKEEVKEIKSTPHTRKSEVDEKSLSDTKNHKPTKPHTRKYVTFA